VVERTVRWLVRVHMQTVESRGLYDLESLILTCRHAAVATTYVLLISLPTHISLFPQRQEQSVTDIPQSRLDHPLLVHPAVTPANPHLNPLLPLRTRSLQSVLRRQYAHDYDALDPVFPQRVDRRARRRARGDDGVHHDGQVRGAAFVLRCGAVVG
jgi:hypothetical protein